MSHECLTPKSPEMPPDSAVVSSIAPNSCSLHSNFVSNSPDLPRSIESCLVESDALTCPGNSSVQSNVCAGCGFAIWDRTMLSALDRNWHYRCLKCYCCGGNLADFGSSFFIRSNIFFCKQDYCKLYGRPGTCNTCQAIIPSHEMVMRFHNFVYHLKCFRCSQCKTPLLPGKKCLLFNTRLFCEREFEKFLPECNFHSDISDESSVLSSLQSENCLGGSTSPIHFSSETTSIPRITNSNSQKRCHTLQRDLLRNSSSSMILAPDVLTHSLTSKDTKRLNFMDDYKFLVEQDVLENDASKPFLSVNDANPINVNRSSKQKKSDARSYPLQVF